MKNKLRPYKYLVLILFIVLTLRIPNLFEPYWYGDEGIYLAVGEGIRQGGLLYRDIFDHKPPAIYILAAISGSLVIFKLFLCLFHLITIFYFWKLAKKFFESSSIKEKDLLKSVNFSTLIFSLLTTLPLLEGHIANAELFMALPTILGFYYLFPFENLKSLRVFLGGLIFSFAFLFKVPAFFDAATIPFFWFITSFKSLKLLKESIFKSILFGVGIFVPILIFGLYFWSKGALDFFIEGTFGQNISYISAWTNPKFTSGEETLFSGGFSFRAIMLAASLGLLFLFKKFLDKTTLIVGLWTLLSMFAMLLSGRPYPHYIIQIIAPVSLLISLLFWGGQRYRFWTVPLLLLVVGSINFYKFYTFPVFSYYQNFVLMATKRITIERYFLNFDQRTSTTYKLSKYIMERTDQQEKIFIWGTEPEVYALSRRLPPGRYITSFHIVDFGGQEETIKSLKDSLPSYIIRMESEQRTLPGLDSLLQDNYLYIQTIDKAQIWKLVEPSLAKYLRQ